MLEIKDRVLAAGMNDFVTKPFNPEELKNTILRQLRPSAGAVTSATTDA